jgi:hypothetical protein
MKKVAARPVRATAGKPAVGKRGSNRTPAKRTGLNGKGAEAQRVEKLQLRLCAVLEEKNAVLQEHLKHLRAEVEQGMEDLRADIEFRAQGEDQFARMKQLCKQLLSQLETDEGMIKELLEMLKEATDPAVSKRSHRKRLAHQRAKEVDKLADVLRRRGVRNPKTQALNDLATEYGIQSGPALYTWLLRNNR